VERSAEASRAPASEDDGSAPERSRSADGDGGPRPHRRVLLIGEDDLSEETGRALDATEADVYRLKTPNDREVRTAFGDGEFDTVAVVARDDAFVLRMALIVRSLSSEVPLLVTLFDPVMSERLANDVGNCRITSLAAIVAPSLAGPLIDSELAAVQVEDGAAVGLRTTGGSVEEVALPPQGRRRITALAQAVFMPYDRSAALLFYGAIGLIAVMIIETLSAAIVLDQPLVDAFYGAAKTLVTVGPNEAVADGPSWFKLFISVSMLLGLGFAASFTAGLVDRVTARRLTGLIGKRAVPRRDHVVVAGLGQVGLQLCLLLRSCGVGVVAIEENSEFENVGRARELGFPVVIGRAADPYLQRRLSLDHARAFAAVTEDDLTNISVAVAARAVNEDLRVVLRAGDGEIANETRSLFKVGLVRDVHRIAGALLAAMALDASATTVVCEGDDAKLLFGDGSLRDLSIDAVT